MDCPCQTYNQLSTIGQLPGELINARAVDESGAPAVVAFFLIDKNGQQVSGPSTVPASDNGYFHVTYPDAPMEVFLQFNSYDEKTLSYTDKYKAQVITFDDLYKSRKVVMVSSSGAAKGGVLLLAVGAAALLLRPGKSARSVGAAHPYVTVIREKVRKANPVYIAGFAVAGYFVYDLFFKYKPKPEQTAILTEAKNMLDYLHFQLGVDVTHSLSEFSAYAGSLRNAAKDCGTDESAIYAVISQLNNEADVYQLIVSAGILAYKSCAANEGNWFGDVHNTVPELITSELSATELSYVNSILSGKGINYRF